MSEAGMYTDEREEERAQKARMLEAIMWLVEGDRLSPENVANAGRLIAGTKAGMDGCWIWQRTKTQSGYGVKYFVGRNRTTFAHRVAYETFIGPIPDGREVDHLCHTRACCNPCHLRAVTHSTNILSRRSVGVRKRKPLAGVKMPKATHCKKGHPFTPENILVIRGGPTCRACDKLRGIAYRKRRDQKRA